ncbi:MAG: hypothetical protein WBB45_05865 [Cyclobacteriaceae bacterium]
MWNISLGRLSRLMIFAFFITFTLPSCSAGYDSYNVMPKNRNRYYKPSKDRHKKRTKRVKVKNTP